MRAAATEPKPDLILLDIMMPDMDRCTVPSTLKDQPETSGIPVIFVTALSDDLDEEFGLLMDAVDDETRPIRSAVLLARARVHLERKRARDRLACTEADIDAEVQRRLEQALSDKLWGQPGG